MRLIFKTLSYGIIHLSVAITVAYLITENIAIALSIGLIEPIVQTGVFAIHDYLWERKSTTPSNNRPINA